MIARHSLRICTLAVALGVVALPSDAHAVERYAVIIGNNAGRAEDVRLRYAEDDARKVYDVLTSLGGFRPENVVLLGGQTADDARRILISINDRVRARAPGDAVLFVYYSGHATADELHMGPTALPLAQLEGLVRGSSAGIRILVLDSCRSGSLTRVKGGDRAPRVAIALDERLAGEGVVFLTASSANEDAQESDEIRGSFFTHYFVSALLGAGDANGDGAVSLGEAYRSAYDATLRASSQTLTLQHPTFHFDVRGQGDLVLARIAHGSQRRGTIAFPVGRTYLVFRGTRDGPVVAEVSSFDRNRRISVDAGSYFVRGRAATFALEGPVEVVAGGAHVVAERGLRRFEYARLVRKGLGPSSITAVRAGLLARSAVASGETPCIGPFAGVQRSSMTWAIEARLAGCRATFANDVVAAVSDELGAEVRLARPFDVGLVAIEPAVVIGGGLLHQVYETRGVAPPRWASVAHLGAATTFAIDLRAGFHMTLEVIAESYLFNKQIDDDRTGFGTAFAVRGGVALGRYFP